jgi:hypothetical protein
MHWYISMMYVVPVVAVGGWGWASSRRMARRKAAGGATSPMHGDFDLHPSDFDL